VKLGLVAGVRHTGKSTLALVIAHEWGRGRVAVWDCTEGLREVSEDPPVRPGPAIWRVTSPSISDLAAHVVRARPGCALIDESWQLQAGAHVNEDLARLVRANRYCHVVMTAHRISDYARQVRMLATDWFLFRTTGVEDLEVIRRDYGEPALEAVRSLSAYEYVHLTRGVGGRLEMRVQRQAAAWNWRGPAAVGAAGKVRVAVGLGV
jgi:hypothetical protein